MNDSSPVEMPDVPDTILNANDYVEWLVSLCRKAVKEPATKIVLTVRSLPYPSAEWARMACDIVFAPQNLRPDDEVYGLTGRSKDVKYPGPLFERMAG